MTSGYRNAIEAFITAEAKPVEKLSHQIRLYRLARRVANETSELPCDDDVLHAAAWLHDLGVFIGHRPENPEALARWDNVAYAMKETPAILDRLGFPAAKIAQVVEAIRTHQPSAEPSTHEGLILRDADILEQLGAIGILRTVCKIGRDTRYSTFDDALETLRRAYEKLPGQLKLPASRRLAEPKLRAMREFFADCAL